MKLSIQEGIYGARDFGGFLEDAKEWGFDAVEVWGEGLRERLGEVKRLLSEKGVAASSVCPGGGGIRGSILSGDEEERERAEGDVFGLLECCAELGGAGLVFVPEFGVRKFMSLYPDHNDFERRKGIFIDRLGPLAARAEDLGVRILLEPLNRYEAFFLLTVGQAAEVCRVVGSGSLRVMADLFHMGIEEDSVTGAIERDGEWIGHVHLVDTNRLLPGLGERDFGAVFSALRVSKYEGYLCMECGVTGDARVDIPRAVEYVKKVLAV